MTTDKKKKKPADQKSVKKSLSVEDLSPKKDPKGGSDHDMPPGQEKKTGGAGGV